MRATTRGNTGHWAKVIVLVAATATGWGCDANSALQQLSDARRFSADLLVQFTKAADSTNTAVMADTDEASIAFAQEADLAKREVQKDVDALDPLLRSLRYSEEAGFLEHFKGQFAAYSELDRRILDLAVQNTNLKAQRLSFGPAFEAADAFTSTLEGVVPSVPREQAWRVRALVATAIGAVREIQALHAPHIADTADSAMSEAEARMQKAESTARSALRSLDALVDRSSRQRLADAGATLDRFVATTQQITGLSRRNTNVRSLTLSLNEKGKVTATCEADLRHLQDALAKRGFAGTR